MSPSDVNCSIQNYIVVLFASAAFKVNSVYLEHFVKCFLECAETAGTIVVKVDMERMQFKVLWSESMFKDSRSMTTNKVVLHMLET